MTDLAITVCRPVDVREKFTGPAATAITLGQYCRLDTSTGKITPGRGTTAPGARTGGIALNTVAAGETVTVVRLGILDVGNALSALAFDADVYLSDTSIGVLADGAGTVSKIVGTVVPGWASGATADKLLRL